MEYWDLELIAAIIKSPAPKKLKYIITDDKDEFITRLELINENAFIRMKDNLKYLEGLEKIARVKAGVPVEEVFPWVKDDK